MVYIIIAHWWKMPFWIALVYLGATRSRLEERNLYDTYLPGEFPNTTCHGVDTASRTLAGDCNALDVPGMGAVGSRFIRMVPINQTWPEGNDTLYTPNPRLISQKLLKREPDAFTPATTLNLLAAVWIQFQTHDWFSHGPVNDPSNMLEWEIPEGDPLRATGQKTMKLARTLREMHGTDRPATYNNVVSHWWDLSPIYGIDNATNARVRSFVDGKLKLDHAGLIPLGDDGLDITGFNDNWNAGLSMLHNIWTREHNAVCDMFLAKYPHWNDEQIYNRARLVTAALNAKVHTVEWTPGLLQDELLATGMDINWNGLSPEWLKNVPLPFSKSVAEDWHGLIGGQTDFSGVQFGHSEEFISVYRLHSLLRDNITIHDHVTGAPTNKTYGIAQYAFKNAKNVIRQSNFTDVVYTFGSLNPGALILGNYPRELTELSKPGVPYTLDMGAVDIIRDRERGVPRYNAFRRLFSLKPAETMDDISDDPETVARLRSVYGDDVESVDLLAGTLSESPRPEGFAISVTQFQLFLLAASRRLMTDRFFTVDYTPETYTQEGLDWIKNSDFRAVIGRAVPELNETVHSVSNAFLPWPVPTSA